jgi:Mg/Co/Ni transporter MgtE
VLDLMPAPQRTKVITLMGFNPDSAGGLMNVDFVSCPATATAGAALQLIAAAKSLQPEALLKMHIIDDDQRLTGVVSVIALLQATASDAVAALMDDDPVRVTADTDLTDIALLMADFNLYSIPVVDDDDHVLGVVTVDDVLEATIPEDWRRREPAPRPVRETATMASIDGQAGDAPGDRP